MTRPQPSPGNVRRRIKPTNLGVSLQELIIWSIGSLVVATLIFGSIAAITLGPRYVAAFGLARTAEPSGTSTPTSSPTNTRTIVSTTEASPPTVVSSTLAPPAATPSLATPSLTPGGTLPASIPTAAPTQPTGASTTSNTATPTNTPPLTNTSTSTATSQNTTTTPASTSTFTLSPTATGLSSGWVFVSTRLHPDPSSNSVTVYGVVVNNTASTQRINVISGMFYNALGQVVVNPAQTSGYWPVDELPPGGQVPFELIASGISDPASYILNVQAQTSTATPRTDFEFTRQGESIGDGLYCAQAAFRNSGADLISYLSIALVLYNNQNNVINLSEAFEPDMADVTGGQTLDMEVCADPLGLTVDHYEWRGWGR